MSEIYLRKYGEAGTVDFSLFEIDGIDFRVDAVHVSGDTTIMKDEGTEANTANGFVDEGNGYSIAFTATEAEAARIVIYLKDQGTKVWLDRTIIIETYGHASAQHAFDLDTANQIVASVSGNVDGNVASVVAAVETDAASRTASQATGFSTHSADDVWTATTRALTTFGTLVADVAAAVWATVTKIGTSVTNAVETDTASRNVSKADVSGLALEATVIARTLLAAGYFDPTTDSVDVNKLLGTLITETNAGDVAESFSFFYDVDPVTTKTVNDVGVAGSGLTAQQVWEYATRILTAAVETDTASRNASKADVSALATTAALNTHDGKLDTVDINIDTLLVRLSALRAGYLDWLNTGGLVATASDIAGITQAQRVRVIVPGSLERPDSGSVTYRIWIYVYNELHQAEDLDSLPTVTAENNTGTDRSANLGTVTKPGATTGQYYVDYTVALAHLIEGIVFKIAATEGAVTTNYAASTIVTDTTAVDFTSADRAKLDEMHDNRLTAARAGYLDNISAGAVALASVVTEARLVELDAANIPADIDAIPTTPMRGTDSANTVVPDAAGVAAGLHTTTDGKVDAVQLDITTMQVDVTEILNYESGDWEIVNNQMIFKIAGGAEIDRFDLTKGGVPDSDSPDKRERV